MTKWLAVFLPTTYVVQGKVMFSQVFVHIVGRWRGVGYILWPRERGGYPDQVNPPPTRSGLEEEGRVP